MSTTIATPRAAAGAVAPPVAGARRVLPAVEPVPERAGAWLWTSLLAAILAAVGNAFALFGGGVYDGQARGLVDQALAQDAVDLALVAPALVVLALLALAGSLRAYVLWLGVLAFTVYSYAIYAFAIRFGPLFLLWVAVLGLAAYSFVGGIVALDHRIVRARLVPAGRAVTAAAWTLLLLGTLFGLAWLREIVPAAVAGGSLGSAAALRLPTNPVHVLDLAFFLPAAIATGALLRWRRGALPYTLAPVLLVVMLLTGLPVLVTPVIQWLRDEPASWGAAGAFAVLSGTVAVVLVWLVRGLRDPADSGLPR